MGKYALTVFYLLWLIAVISAVLRRKKIRPQYRTIYVALAVLFILFALYQLINLWN